MSVFAIAVHSSLGYKKDDYFFLYKGREFRYVPQWRNNDSDTVLTILQRDTEAEVDGAYLLIAELMSVISFERDCRIILESGMISHGRGLDLANFSGGDVARRTIPVSETMDEFWYIPPIRTRDQSAITRLYREARASNNLYLSILFYWHVLTYPESEDVHAVMYLNKFVSSSSSGPYSGPLERVIQNPLMLKDVNDFNSFGDYVNRGVRHSIAHFVRRANHQEKSIVIDDFQQIRHLNDVKSILKNAARDRIANEFGINEAHDMSIFRYTRHSDYRNSIG